MIRFFELMWRQLKDITVHTCLQVDKVEVLGGHCSVGRMCKGYSVVGWGRERCVVGVAPHNFDQQHHFNGRGHNTPFLSTIYFFIHLQKVWFCIEIIEICEISLLYFGVSLTHFIKIFNEKSHCKCLLFVKFGGLNCSVSSK